MYFHFRTNFALFEPILNPFFRRIGVYIHNSKIFSNNKQVRVLKAKEMSTLAVPLLFQLGIAIFLRTSASRSTSL